MSKKETETPEQTELFDVMPGADRPEEESEPLDLSFDVVEEVVAETEAEEPDETVSEDEQSTEEETVEEEVEEDEVVEVEAEEEEVVEAEIESEKPKKSPMVPKARLDEVLAKQKALQKQLDEINAANEKAEEAPDAYDFDSKEIEYQNMVLDGESEKRLRLEEKLEKQKENSWSTKCAKKCRKLFSKTDK